MKNFTKKWKTSKVVRIIVIINFNSSLPDIDFSSERNLLLAYNIDGLVYIHE